MEGVEGGMDGSQTDERECTIIAVTTPHKDNGHPL